MLKSYSFQKYKKNKNRLEIKNINVFNSKNFKLKNFHNLNNLLISVNYTKNLVSEPANILNPVTYAERCLKLRKLGLKVKVLNLERIKKIGIIDKTPIVSDKPAKKEIIVINIVLFK